MKHSSWKRILIAFLLSGSFSISGRSQSASPCSDKSEIHHHKILLGRMRYIEQFMRSHGELVCRGPFCECGNNYSKYHIYWVPDEEKYNKEDNVFWLRQHLKNKDRVFVLCTDGGCNENFWENCDCILESEMDIVVQYKQAICWKKAE